MPTGKTAPAGPDPIAPRKVGRARLESIAELALNRWNLPAGASARLVNRAENSTFVVEAAGRERAILRLYRRGHRTEQEIRSELDWSDALIEAGAVAAPKAIPGGDGNRLQLLKDPGGTGRRAFAMFEFVDGGHPDEGQELLPLFEWLGETAARLHLHSASWKRPDGFSRPTWDLDAAFGPDPAWGRWADAPNLTAEAASILSRLQSVLERRLRAYGTGRDRFGLIHADMRLANVIVADGVPTLIDFDDCCFGWHLYDFAASVSFIEDSPRIPEMKSAWTEGYRRARPLATGDERELDSFVMFRRLALLAWVGSRRGDATEASALADRFAQGTAELAEGYLSRFG